MPKRVNKAGVENIMANSTNKSKLFVNDGEAGEEILDRQVVLEQPVDKIEINDLKMRLFEKIKLELSVV